MSVDAQSILTSVLARAGLDYLSPTMAVQDPQILEIVELINETGCDLAARGQWQALLRVAIAHQRPDDFSAIASVMTDRGPARLVTEPSHWAFLLSRPPSRPYFRIGDGRIEVTGGTATTMEYWSSWWSESGPKVIADGDAVYLPPQCMIGGTFYRWLRKKGLPFDDQMAQHEADVATAQKADRGL